MFKQLSFFSFLIFSLGCAGQLKNVDPVQSLPVRICFGSCANQDKEQPILRHIINRKPDIFIYLGDNIYGDTTDMNILKGKYEVLAKKPEFQELRSQVPLLATWDDHDYGADDAGKNYPKKEETKQIFLDFWQEPKDSPRRQHAGIYTDYLFSKD